MPKPGERVAAADRHAAQIAGLRRAVFDSPGVSGRAVRAAAASADGLPPPLGGYVAKVSDAAYRITDGDVAALTAAGCSEEEIFEVTVAAAVGARCAAWMRACAPQAGGLGMRLEILDRGHRARARLFLRLIRGAIRHPIDPVAQLALYRTEFFGDPFLGACRMRPSSTPST